MGFAVLGLELVAVFILVFLLLHRHGNILKLHIAVTLSVFVAWFFSFVIIFVVPMDVSNTLYDKCLTDFCPNGTTNCTSDCNKPLSYLPQKYLEIFWNIVFWSSQVLTWLILPLLSSYVAAGEFTIGGKIKSALFENAVIYGTLGLLFGVLLIYVVASKHLSSEAIKVLCITASNTWGLLVLIFLMGYGFVQVPRSAWENSNYSDMLTKKRFDVSKIKIELDEAQEKLTEIVEEVKHVNRLVPRGSELRKFVNIIIEKCPSLQNEDLENINYDDYAAQPGYGSRDETSISRSSLVSIHAKVISTHYNKHRCQVIWDRTVEEALDLEDWLQLRSKGFHYKSVCESLQYLTRVFLIPVLLKTVAVTFAVTSVVLVWSEMLFSIKKPTLSICALIVDAVRSPALVVFVCIILISYMCLCAYYTIFKLRLFNYYYMAPAQQTDDYSLLFSATVLSRLTTPLSLNFLSLVHEDPRYNAEIQTAFSKIMGSFEVIPFIAKGFNVYYPILIALIGIATILKLGTRCLAFLGFEAFVADDDISMDYVEEGKQLLARERRSRERGDKRSAVTSSRRNGGTSPSSQQPRDNDRARLLDSSEDAYSDTTWHAQGQSDLRSARSRDGYSASGGFSSRNKSSNKKSLFDDV